MAGTAVAAATSRFGAWMRRVMGAVALVATAALTAAPAQAQAADVEAANSLVRETSAKILSLAEQDGADAEKRKSFEMLLEASADVTRIAKYTVGRPWRRMSDQQKTDYQAAIIPYVANRFVKSFNDFRGGSLKFKSSSTETVGREERVMVSTVGRRPASSEATDILWVVTELEGRPVVLDVRIEKLSLVIQLKNEIATNLSSVGGDFDKLIARLRASVL